ncbi:MAG: hypothetical protein JNK82_09775 [Myxococcaceae bacterium]|nr:hypothetical protein [Myxococcaceae bacterium]
MKSAALLLVLLAVACVPTGDFDGGTAGGAAGGGSAGGMAGPPDASTGWNIALYAGSGMRGAVDGPPGTARFDDPRGLALDSSGNLYVADRGNRAIRKVDPQGNVTTLPGRFYGPDGVAVTAGGEVIVADTQDQCLWRIVGGAVTRYAGHCRAGDAGYLQCIDIDALAVGDVFDVTFGAPSGMAIDHDAGVLLIADERQRTLRFKPLSRGWVGTLAGKEGYMGQSNGACGPNYCCGATAIGFPFICYEHNATFREPASVAVAPNGDVWVADRENCAVRRLESPHTAMCSVSTPVSDPQCGAGESAVNAPSGVAVAPDGEVYVSDTANQRVVRLDLTAPPLRRIRNVTRMGWVSNPWGLVAGSDGRLFVVDNGTNSIRVLTRE